jgi:hypothetical protein
MVVVPCIVQFKEDRGLKAWEDLCLPLKLENKEGEIIFSVMTDNWPS